MYRVQVATVAGVGEPKHKTMTESQQGGEKVTNIDMTVSLIAYNDLMRNYTKSQNKLQDIFWIVEDAINNGEDAKCLNQILDLLKSV